MEKTTDICNVSKDATFEMNCCIFFIFLPFPVFIHTKKRNTAKQQPCCHFTVFPILFLYYLEP